MTKTLKGINGNPLLKVNKHCMTDGEREYYRTEKGDWKPGRYDGKKFVWTSTTKYAARARTFEMADGTTKTVRLTKYTYESFLKPAYAPVGKTGRQYARAYQECYRALYWDGEYLWKACNVAVEFDDDGKPTRYINSIEVFTDYLAMWDRWPEVERDITMEVPETETTETETTTTTSDERTEIVKAAECIVEAEAARLAWIESTTTEGEQISILAYAGYYGDTAWQELAYATNC